MSSRAFALTDSPFAVLGVSPRAGQAQIEAALARHPSRPRAIADLLLDARTRLAHELAWLQGLSGGAAEETLRLAHGGYKDQVASRLNNLRGLNKANLAAHAAERFSDPVFVEAMAKAWEGVDTADATARVNEERAVAGLPPAAEPQVAWALDEVRARHGATAARVLTRGGEDPEALSHLIQRSAATESESGRRFLDAVVAAYGEQQADALEKLERGLIHETDASTRSGSTDLRRFEGLMDRWRAAMAPLRELARLRGREETRALRLVGDLRSVYLDPSPGPGRVAPAVEIARLLQAEFSHSTAIQRMVSGDLNRLSASREASLAPTEAARTGSVGDRAEARKAERERNVGSRRGGVQDRSDARRAAREHGAASSSRNGTPARTAIPTTPASVIPAVGALRGQVVEQLRKQAEAARDSAREALADGLRPTPEAKAKKKQKGGFGVVFLIMAGFWVVNWIGDRFEQDSPDEAPPVAAAPAPVLSDEDQARAVAAMLARSDRTAEVMPEPGTAPLRLEETTYCLFTARRLQTLAAGVDEAHRHRVAPLFRDFNARCAGRDAEPGAAAMAAYLMDGQEARLDRDATRIAESWRER